MSLWLVVSDVRLRMLVLISCSVWRKDVRPWGALGMLSSIGSVVVYWVLFPWFKRFYIGVLSAAATRHCWCSQVVLL